MSTLITTLAVWFLVILAAVAVVVGFLCVTGLWVRTFVDAVRLAKRIDKP